MSKKFKKEADEIFKAHQNMEEVFVTSDGQGFTDEHKAHDHSRILNDKSVELHRNPNAENAEDAGSDDADREELVTRYEELFEKKPAHNMKTENIKAKIEEKEKELAQE